jgi:hypothetical protein
METCSVRAIAPTVEKSTTYPDTIYTGEIMLPNRLDRLHRISEPLADRSLTSVNPVSVDIRKSTSQTLSSPPTPSPEAKDAFETCEPAFCSPCQKNSAAMIDSTCSSLIHLAQECVTPMFLTNLTDMPLRAMLMDS